MTECAFDAREQYLYLQLALLCRELIKFGEILTDYAVSKASVARTPAPGASY